MLDHLSIQCADVEASAAFYDTVLATIGGTRILDFGEVIGYGVPAHARLLARPPHAPARASGSPTSPSPPPTGRRSTRSSRRAGGAGAEVLHEARVWPEYHPNYYGAFLRDPDGNNVEAVCHSPG